MRQIGIRTEVISPSDDIRVVQYGKSIKRIGDMGRQVCVRRVSDGQWILYKFREQIARRSRESGRGYDIRAGTDLMRVDQSRGRPSVEVEFTAVRSPEFELDNRTGSVDGTVSGDRQKRVLPSPFYEPAVP